MEATFRDARLYAALLLILGSYAIYSLARVFVGLGNLREKAALMRAERRVANIRQIVLLLLLLFGITAANEVFGVFCRVRVVQSSLGDLDVISACGPRAAFAF